MSPGPAVAPNHGSTTICGGAALDARCHIVALHGWGSDSRSWQALIQQLPRSYSLQLIDLPGFGRHTHQPLPLEQWLAQLAAGLPHNCVLLGWSLGGMLATRLAAMNGHVRALITVASNVKFVAASDWAPGMAQTTFEQFRSDFSQSPAATLKRFRHLQAMGDIQARRVANLLQRQACFHTQYQAAWLAALDMLAAADNRACFSQLELPGMHIFGRDDALVPAAVAAQLPALNPEQSTCVLPEAGHAPHLSQPELVAQVIRDFITHTAVQPANRPRGALKKTIAKNFSQAAKAYDSVARLQKKVQQQLLVHTRRQRFPEGPVVDLGCGTGTAMAALQQQFPGQSVWGLDFAAGMLQVAQQAQAQRSFLQADIEQLPFAGNSLALCFSSLSLQWCEPEAFLAELYRVLMPGGMALFSTLGPQTLFELKQSWRVLDKSEHVNQFASAEKLKSAIHRSGLVKAQSEQQHCVLYYPSVRHLMRELKGIGARNINPSRRKGLSSARQLHLLEHAYRDHFSKGDQIPASYEVFFFTLLKPL